MGFGFGNIEFGHGLLPCELTLVILHDQHTLRKFGVYSMSEFYSMLESIRGRGLFQVRTGKFRLAPLQPAPPRAGTNG
jgi:hypothetical protein